MRTLPCVLFLFICTLTYGQNTYPTNGTAILNSGENRSLVIRDGRSGINWNYLEWQFSNGTRDWVLGRGYTSGNFTLWREGLNEVLTVDNSGKTGIGTSIPSTLLSVSGNEEDLLHLSRKTNAAGDNIYLVFSHGNNTASANARGKIGVNVKAGGAGRLVFQTGYSNTLVEHMRIDEVGNVGIGTTNPRQKLEVKGTVYSSEVKVDVSAGTGPDYVFEPTYNLPTLAETEAYIKANKHLPEVPSAKEMEVNGINLSEMNMLLLKKVEELTLHLIEQQKQNSLQQAEIEILKSKIK